MLKKLINECQFNLTIKPEGPFLIADGRWEKPSRNKFLPDKVFISKNSKQILDTIATAQTENSALNQFKALDYYVPGTSLRGIIRSHAEKIVRTLAPEGKELCCNPFQKDKKAENDDQACGFWMDEKKPNGKAYAHSCPVCRLFGSTQQAGRIHVQDGEVEKNAEGRIIGKGTVGMRDGIGIDRFTGGTYSGAKFKTMALEGYSFTHSVRIRNFEVWQLGLLAYVLRDLQEGYLTLGSGSSKGFGRIKGTVSDLKFIYYGTNPTGNLLDVGDLFSDKAYGFLPGKLPEPKLLKLRENESYFSVYEPAVAIEEIWKICSAKWNEQIEKFPALHELRKDVGKSEEKEKGVVQ